jgi:hypothetical protein
VRPSARLARTNAKRSTASAIDLRGELVFRRGLRHRWDAACRAGPSHLRLGMIVKQAVRIVERIVDAG